LHLRARLADDPQRNEALVVMGLLGGLSAVAVAIVLWLPKRLESARRQAASHAE
jgi:ethanolamine transporter EutH